MPGPCEKYDQSDQSSTGSLLASFLMRTAKPDLIKQTAWMSRLIWASLSRLMTKPTKWLCAQRKISLGIRPVWLESSLSAWRKLGSLAAHWEHSEDSDQTGRMPRLIWVFAGCTCHFVGFDMRRLNYYLASFILPRLKWSSLATVINLNKNKIVWSPLSVTSIVKMLFMDLQGILRRLPVQAIFLIAQVRILKLLSFLLYLFIF